MYFAGVVIDWWVTENGNSISSARNRKGDFTKTFESSDCKELALAFVDCDSYRGTKYLIETIFDNFLVAGGLMVFEDYGHASLLGNRIAVHQAFDKKENAFCFFSHFSGSYFVCKIK